MRERRGTTPLAYGNRTPLKFRAMTNPTVRFYWAAVCDTVQPFFRRLPGDGRIKVDASSLVSDANPLPGR